MTTSRLALVLLAVATPGRMQAQAKTRAQESVDQSRRTAIVTSAAKVSPSVVSVGVVGRRRVQQSPFDMFFAPEGNEMQGQNLRAFPVAAQLLPGSIRPDPQRPPAFTGMRTGDRLWR